MPHQTESCATSIGIFKTKLQERYFMASIHLNIFFKELVSSRKYLTVNLNVETEIGRIIPLFY